MTVHENVEPREEVSGSSNRVFGLTFSGFFLVVGVLPFLWGGAGPIWGALWTGVAFLATALFFPAALGLLNRLWFRFGLILHRIVSPIVLGIMFYGVVLPTGLVMRVLRKDPLRLRFDRAADSYWIKRDPPGPPADSFRDQF